MRTFARTIVCLFQDISYSSAFCLLTVVSLLRVTSDLLYHHHIRTLLKKADTSREVEDDSVQKISDTDCSDI